MLVLILYFKGGVFIKKQYFNSGILIFLTFVVNIVISIFSIEIFILDKDQLLYLFSMIGQIICGIFALTLTSYIFFEDKLKIMGNDDIYYEATLELRNKYFKNLKSIAFLVGFLSLLSISGIIMLSTVNQLLSILINFTVSFFFITLISILNFGVTVLNPKMIDDEIKILGDNAKEKLAIGSDKTDETDVTDVTQVSLEKFIVEYNSLEQTIVKIAENLQTTFVTKGAPRYVRPQIIQSLNTLLKFSIIDKEQLDYIHEIRMYRNKLIHETDIFKIPSTLCDKIVSFKNEISEKTRE